VILEARAISERRFADWSMCFAGQPISEEVYRRYCITDEFMPMKMTADSMLSFMGALIDATPNAVRMNRPDVESTGSNPTRKIFGERVLNREKYRDAPAPATPQA